MVKKQCLSCGLVYGLLENHLDHIAPLCAHLNIPLVVTDEEMELLAKDFYPDLVVFYFPLESASSEIISKFDIIYTCFPRSLFDSFFFLQQKLLKKKPLTIWCPHGNSDKGQEIYFAEALSGESVVLIYGSSMLSFFQKKQALSPSCHVFYIGNYRLDYYLKHQSFYKNKISSKIEKKFSQKQTTLLYSPTWNDKEGYSSISVALPSLIKKIPKELNLIIKLHPNTFLEDDLLCEKLMWEHENDPNLLFLKKFPSIYPLLDFIDIYLGDSSSMGYDMLYFNKPLLFINMKGPKYDLPLFESGHVIYQEDLDGIYQLLDEKVQDDSIFSQMRKELYERTFSSKVNLISIKHEIESIWKQQ